MEEAKWGLEWRESGVRGVGRVASVGVIQSLERTTPDDDYANKCCRPDIGMCGLLRCQSMTT